MSSAENNTGATAAVVFIPPAKTITLKTADDHSVSVKESIAMEFATVKAFFDDNSDAAAAADAVIPLPNVSLKYLKLIEEYCEEQLKLREESATKDQKIKYDEDFAKGLKDEDMKELLLAVNYLNIKSFMDVLTQAVADRIKDFSVEKVRVFFGIENDFTAAEEAEIRAKNQWAHE